MPVPKSQPSGTIPVSKTEDFHDDYRSYHQPPRTFFVSDDMLAKKMKDAYGE
jgi:hypothetical protein